MGSWGHFENRSKAALGNKKARFHCARLHLLCSRVRRLYRTYRLFIFKNIIMALEIATIPVLTGKVAENFENQATEAYQRKLMRDAHAPHSESYERGVKMVQKIMANSKL